MSYILRNYSFFSNFFDPFRFSRFHAAFRIDHFEKLGLENDVCKKNGKDLALYTGIFLEMC